MAATTDSSPHQALNGYADPFLSSADDPSLHDPSQNYTAFNAQVLSLNATSPSHAKRAIEAHIAETNRRLEDASRLGSSLVQQRSDLSEKLKEVEARKNDTELPAELRDRLAEIERDYNDLGRETARALQAPQSRLVSEEQPGDPSPAVFSSHGSSSPTKVSVPSRKQRNQPASRADNIQFAADISTSLLVQVRQLQTALASREEALKAANAEKSRLESEAGGFSQRLRAMDESEQRYKDENWNLETQRHEMKAVAEEAADREKKLSLSLAAALAEKSKAQNDLDETRLAHAKLGEDHSAARKLHDSEMHSVKRDLELFDGERESLQKKVDDLTSQNHELARAFGARSRARENDGENGLDLEENDDTKESLTPEHSPPPSPTKATPRHGALESETLKSSLHHAHRMIQNLKGNIHREKTEKVELRRMLQDARDELEQRRGDGGAHSGNKRPKTKPEAFKKSGRPDMLGGSRRARTDIEVDEPDWEDHAGDASPSRRPTSRLVESAAGHRTESEAYQTANDTEGGAFETANERESESEEFQTGAESLAGESTDEGTETETEGGIDRSATLRGGKPVIVGNTPRNRNSYMSTASTSADEADSARTSGPNRPARYRLKVGRGGASRHSKALAESSSRETTVSAQGSPVNLGSSPPPQEQSLFTELGDFNGGGSEFGTPGKASIFSARSTPGATSFNASQNVEPMPELAPPRVMIDSGTMTEPWKPELRTNIPPALNLKDNRLSMAPSIYTPDLPPPSPSEFPLPPSLATSPDTADPVYTPFKGLQESPNHGPPNFITPPKTVWDEAYEPDSVESRKQVTSAPSVPTFAFSKHSPKKDNQEGDSSPSPPVLSFSPIISQETVPVASQPEKPAPKEDSNGTATKVAAGAVAGAGVGILGTFGAALGFGRARQPEPVIAEDEPEKNRDEPSSSEEKELPLKDISGNAAPKKEPQVESAAKKAEASEKEAESTEKKAPVAMAPPIITASHSAQTDLTAEEIEDALRRRAEANRASNSSPPPLLKPLALGGAMRPPSRGKPPVPDPESAALFAGPKRPGTATSVNNHPPLPADHRNAIAKAGGRVSTSSPLPDPAQQATASGPGLMGPPLAPASAYRRPRTPADQNIASPSRGSATPRATHRSRAGTGSQLSRRSSVSSFASELDERFNIRTDGLPMHRNFEVAPGTDPRMIQAITQTMIGEYLWKYTRKAGRPDMSNTRHRRYFWVHPYTRTLYWSDTDPQAAGGKELKAKSVAIESVRVVADDNPIPPWLHRKSLEVVTPSRKVKFTAESSSRHEAWFNALSYLLMRNHEPPTPSGADGTGITEEDVNEFNPSTHRSRVGASRASVSSYNSAATRGTHYRTSRQGPPSTAIPSLRPATANSVTALPPTHTPEPGDDANRTLRRGSVSRLSSLFKPASVRGSVARRSVRSSTISDATIRPHTSSGGQRATGEGSIYDAQVVRDGGFGSVEDLRRELSRHERESEGRLENVRACCDGKHDVSDLANGGGKHHHHHHDHSKASSTQTTTRNRLTASISSRVR